MKILIACSALLSILLISSCQKEVSYDRQHGATGGDSTILWKFVMLDTSLSSGRDTTGYFLFEYDNQKRIHRTSVYLRTDTTTTSNYSYKSEILFYYTGTDTLPFKKTIMADDLNYHQRDTSYYFYQDGWVKFDSTINFESGPSTGINWLVDIHTYDKSGNNIQSGDKYYGLGFPNPSVCQSTSAYVETYVNGNITGETASSSGCMFGSWDEQVVYDNKINPFYTTDIHLPVLYPNTSSLGDFNSGRNNVIQRISSSLNVNTQYYYEYRGDGYPLTVRVVDLANPGTNDSGKGLYLYTR